MSMYPLEAGDAEAAFAAGYAGSREIQAQGTGSAMTAESTLQPDLPGLLERDPEEGAGDG